MPGSCKPETERDRYRAIVADNAPLVALLRELYPARSIPSLNATDREIGAFMGQQMLIERLEKLLAEAHGAPDGQLPKVL